MSASGDPAGGTFADQAFAVASVAYVQEPGEWPNAVHAAIVGLFDFLAAHPDQTETCLTANGRSEALARQDRAIARYTDLLQRGFESVGMTPPTVVVEAIGGGIYELVRGYALEHRLGDLPLAAPQATHVALSPFVGGRRARELGETARAKTSQM